MPAYRHLDLPDFGSATLRPNLPAATYEARARAATAKAGTDWLVVYADREHFGNMVFLTGFEPRFEEALLLLGRKGERVLITGNECGSYAKAMLQLPGTEVLLAQSLSLMAQDRSAQPRIFDQLLQAGVKLGDSLGLVGWKYLESEEDDEASALFFLPHAHVQMLKRAVGAKGQVMDCTRVLMHPEQGLRASIDADVIAQAEWANAKAARGVWRILSGFRLGDSEYQAASRMGYDGEAFNVHPMLSSASPGQEVVGLRSPTTRQPQKGDGITTALGYWGGLSSRAGLVKDEDEAFMGRASAYFAGLAAWYTAAAVGVGGDAVFAAVTAALARGGLRSALNPGHLTDAEEWFHSPIRPGSSEKLRSGMLMQVDVIPVPFPAGQALNCEDGVALADGTLRAALAQKYPEVAARIDKRRAFMRRELGLVVSDDVLPLSDIPAFLPPLWLKPNLVCVAG